MATAVKQGFTILKSSLEITDLQEETVSTRHNNVRLAIAQELRALESFLTGSYSRHTMIAPLSKADVDVFVVLHPSYYEPNGQARLLDKVKRVLTKKYPNTSEISRNGQAVTIRFSDFAVDVVPAFARSGGGYIIPSTRGIRRWIETDPRIHVEISSRENKAHNGELVPLVKMIKCWNRAVDEYFRSFHLEVLAWAIFQECQIADYPSAIRYFFQQGSELILQRNPDPAGYNDDVGFYVHTRRKCRLHAAALFARAYHRACKAEEYDRQGKAEHAINEWRKIFGSYFPAYG